MKVPLNLVYWADSKAFVGNWLEFENTNTPLSIMNLGVVIIYPGLKLKWADAADVGDGGVRQFGVYA